MSSSETSSKLRVEYLILAIAIPILYVLSVGPAVMIYDRFGPFPLFETFYSPVEWVADNTPLGGPLNAYVGLWD